MAAHEEQQLRQVQSSGSRDALRDLLVAHQDRIYNACYQVLGRAEDAEDAAQEALLKLAEGARAARDADSFRGWVYRVSFRIALDHWRRREAVKNRESRAAMNRPASPPLDDRERIALFEAMDGLDDRERALLLEHYFEKVPLADLGERHGISAVAIWKRIDRAREKLKKALLGAGFVVATSRVSEALEASVPAAAPATLVGEAVLGKILAGGLAVGATKSSTLPVAVVTLVLLFGVSTGGYLLVRSRGSKPRVPMEQGKVSDEPIATTVPSTRAAAVEPPGSAPADPVPASNDLRERLKRYAAWHAQFRSKPYDHVLRQEGWKQLKGAREQIFEDPATFLEFIRDAANEEICEFLIGDALNRTEDRPNFGLIVHGQKYAEFPPALMEGILELLRLGTPTQQKGLLGFLGTVHEVPEGVDRLYEQLIDHPDPAIQAKALDALWRFRSLSPSTLDRVRKLFETATDQSVQSTAIWAISSSDQPEPRQWVVDRLETLQEPFLKLLLAEAAVRMNEKSAYDAASLDRIAAAMSAAVGDRPWILERWITAALQLPAAQSSRVLEAAIPHAKPPRLQELISKTLEKVRTGGIEPRSLSNEFWREARKN